MSDKELKPTRMTLLGMEIFVDESLKADEWYLKTFRPESPLVGMDEDKLKKAFKNCTAHWTVTKQDVGRELCVIPAGLGTVSKLFLKTFGIPHKESGGLEKKCLHADVVYSICPNCKAAVEKAKGQPHDAD